MSTDNKALHTVPRYQQALDRDGCYYWSFSINTTDSKEQLKVSLETKSNPILYSYGT